MRLATDGVRLGTQYAWQWCAPTRGSLLSGRYPMHTGYAGGGMPGDGEGMDLRVPLISDELKRVGYKTHMIGSEQAAPPRNRHRHTIWHSMLLRLIGVRSQIRPLAGSGSM